MKRFLLIIFLMVTFPIISNARGFEAYYPDGEKPEKAVVIKAGTYMRVMPVREISTFSGDIGDECEFINRNDMFANEYLAIPMNSHVYGMIEDIREPVQGNNGAIKIKINKIVTPDEATYYVDGYVYSPNGNYIGGEMTAPAFYRKTPHFTQGWGVGVLQLTPLNIYEYGKHTKIKPGTELNVILTKDLDIY